jgi:LmbE family N-acetylglucosaminyl deacetylase
MTIIYLSAHFDDAALSCGGLIWEQVQSGNSVEVWTICAGALPTNKLSPFAEELHHRWQVGHNAVALRRSEDIQSCQILGARFYHFDIPDAIYRVHPKTREYLYSSGETIMGDLARSERPLLRRLATQIAERLPQDSILISPLGLGHHVDHQLTRKVADMQKVSIAYYADYPYVIEHKSSLHNLLPHDCQPTIYPVSQAGLIVWQESIAAYKSQISTFWGNLDQMKEEIREYRSMAGGITLWCLPNFLEESS